MTEQGYAREIKRRCQALGVWRDEFEKTQKRLAKIYVRIDDVEAAYEADGRQAIVEHTNKAGATNLMRNPYLQEIDMLYDQALTYERELGLTAAALKKINEDALKTRKARDGLEAALKLLEA